MTPKTYRMHIEFDFDFVDDTWDFDANVPTYYPTPLHYVKAMVKSEGLLGIFDFNDDTLLNAIKTVYLLPTKKQEPRRITRKPNQSHHIQTSPVQQQKPLPANWILYWTRNR